MKFKDLLIALTDVIKENGGEVLSSETDEGFNRPAYFVSILPVSIEKNGQWYEKVTANCQIRYCPKVETDEECVRVADLLCGVFSEDLHIEGRTLTVGDLVFDIDGYTLTMEFPVEFMRNSSKALEELPYMENIILREEI